MRGYKVLYRIGDKLVSKADKRLAYPAVVGHVLKMPPPGIFLSTKKEYVLAYYSDGSDAEYDEPGMEEVLLTLEFSPKDILRGNFTDQDPEAAVSAARVVAIETTAGAAPQRHGNPVASSRKARGKCDFSRFRTLAVDEDAGSPLRAWGAINAYRIGTYWTVPVLVSLDELVCLSPFVASKKRLRSVEEATTELPPIEVGVFADGGGWIIDGNHRLAAAIKARAASILARFTFAASPAAPARHGNPARPPCPPPRARAPKAKVLSMQAHRNKIAHEHRRKINKVKTAYVQAMWHLGYEPLRTKKGDINARSFNMLKDIAGHLYDSLEITSETERRKNPADVVSLDAFKAARTRSVLEAKIMDVLARIAIRMQGIDPTTKEARAALKFAADTLIDGHAKGWFLRSSEDRLKPIR